MYRHGLVFLRINTQIRPYWLNIPIQGHLMFAYPKKTVCVLEYAEKNVKLKYHMLKILLKAKLKKNIPLVFIPLWHNCLFVLGKIKNVVLFLELRVSWYVCILVHVYQREFDSQFWNPIQLGYHSINKNFNQHLIWIEKRR